MTPELLAILTIVEKLIWPLLGWIGWELRGIRMRLDTIHERLVEAESWQEAHDKQDDERHEGHDRRIRRLEWGKQTPMNGDA